MSSPRGRLTLILVNIKEGTTAILGSPDLVIIMDESTKNRLKVRFTIMFVTEYL